MTLILHIFEWKSFQSESYTFFLSSVDFNSCFKPFWEQKHKFGSNDDRQQIIRERMNISWHAFSPNTRVLLWNIGLPGNQTTATSRFIVAYGLLSVVVTRCLSLKVFLSFFLSGERWRQTDWCAHMFSLPYMELQLSNAPLPSLSRYTDQGPWSPLRLENRRILPFPKTKCF